MDPIAKLMEDHRVFLTTIESYRADLGRPKAGPSVPAPVPRRVAEFAGFLAHDVDRIHGRQEERGLFPVLGRHLPPEGGPISVMLGEHEELRGHARQLDRSGAKLASDPEDADAWTRVRAAFGGADRLLAEHVEKEDSVLFPMAYDLLSRRELDEIAQVFEEVEVATGPVRR